MVTSNIQPQGCTNFKLRQLVRRVTQHYDAELAKAGLKTSQFSLLSHLIKPSAMRPVDLAAEMTMDASTLTRNLKPLIAAGWVQLAAGVDGRSRLVSITDEGRAKHRVAKLQWRTAQNGINASLGVANVVALHTLIDASMEQLATTPHGEHHE